ncbi:unnamed protein product [Musa acuminata var. zebrina]
MAHHGEESLGDDEGEDHVGADGKGIAGGLVANGKVSLGISQPSGPQDQAKLDTKRHTSTTTQIATPCSSSLVALKLTSRMPPIATCVHTDQPPLGLREAGISSRLCPPRPPIRRWTGH